MATKFYTIVEFKKGLQIVPNNWLSADLSKAYWPANVTNNNRYDKSVKNMEKPESNWLQYPILKIYGTFHNYAVARIKLKEAEVVSEINSGAEIEKSLKKSRKFRAAKVIDESNELSKEIESSDEVIQKLDIPKFPKTHSSNVQTERTQRKKGVQNDVNNFKTKYQQPQIKNKSCIRKRTDSYNLHSDGKMCPNEKLSGDVTNTIQPQKEQSFDEDDADVNQYNLNTIQRKERFKGKSTNNEDTHSYDDDVYVFAEQPYDEDLNTNQPMQVKKYIKSTD